MKNLMTSRPFVLALVFTLGTLLSTFLYVRMRQTEWRLLEANFERVAQAHVQEMEEVFAANRVILRSLQRLYASSHHVDREEFKAFLDTTFERHPEILSLEWLPRVTAAEKARFEEDARKELPGFEIWEAAPGNRRIPAQPREEYFPVFFMQPERQPGILGFDHASEPERRQAMDAVRDLGNRISVIVKLTRVPQNEPDRSGLISFKPVYRNGAALATIDDRRASLTGFVAAVYHLPKLIQSAIRRKAELEKTGLRLRIYGGSSPVLDPVIYTNREWKTEEAREGAGGLQWTGQVDALGLPWRVEVYATPEFLASHHSVAWLNLLFGLMFTLLLCGTLFNVLGRASVIEHVVAERTAQLLMERQRYSQLLERAPDPIAVLDGAGVIRSMNPAAEIASGYAAGEVVGRSIDEAGLMSEASLGKALAEFLRVAAGEERPPFEIQIIRKDKSVAVFEVNPELVRTEKGPEILVIFRDVTSRKEMEGELRQKALELANTNEELSRREKVAHSLLEDLDASRVRLQEQARQLERANRRLQELSALKDEFVAKASHELRTPLTSVREGLSLMLDQVLGPVSEAQKDFLNTMSGDIDRLTELINNMLDIAKIESGRMRLQRRRVSPAELIRSTVRSYRAISGNRNIEEKLESTPDVFADPNRMLQVLGNLFSNAMKYGSPGGRIAFGVERRDGSVAISVEDEGPGISEEDLGKLFQKFSQVGSQDGNRPKGTGLGLVVCKELVELHGGAIQVESEVGKGTRFTIFLPAYTNEAALNQSFSELKLHESSKTAKDTVGLVVVDGSEACGPTAEQRRRWLENAAAQVRQWVHQGDVVLEFEPARIAVMAKMDSEGVQAMVGRLKQSLPSVDKLKFGIALEPEGGLDGATLYHRASQSLSKDEIMLTTKKEKK